MFLKNVKSKMFKLIKISINYILEKFGFVLHRKINQKNEFNRKGNNLNIGCGYYLIKGFKSFDIYTEHYHATSDLNFVQYDIRNDSLKISDGTVDNIYISHVIEHIEDCFVENFLRETQRVLKVGGVLRIACPDAEFLYDVSAFQNDYWHWRKEWFSGINSVSSEVPDQFDYFIREISTPRSRFYKNQIAGSAPDKQMIASVEYPKIRELLTSNLKFRVNCPGDHINAWDFEKLKSYGLSAGFKRILKSKPGGSVSFEMQGEDMDLTAPNMSLYVEMIK